MTKEGKMEIIEKGQERYPETGVMPPVQGPMEIIAQAVQRGAGEKELEILERMFEFDLRVKAQAAKEAYHKAMAAFKANPPKIWRDMQVKYGSGNSAQEWSHSDLGIAGDAISRSLGEHKLNHTWRTEPQEDGKTKVTCIIAHELGHSESTWLWSDPDKTGSKNSIQAIGSAIFYLERYTLFALSGLAPAHMDTDGKLAGKGDAKPEYISTDQQKEITKKIKSIYGDDPSMFFSWLGFETVDTIPQNQFKRAMDGLKKAETKKAAMEKDAKRMREPGDDDE